MLSVCRGVRESKAMSGTSVSITHMTLEVRQIMASHRTSIKIPALVIYIFKLMVAGIFFLSTVHFAANRWYTSTTNISEAGLTSVILWYVARQKTYILLLVISASVQRFFPFLHKILIKFSGSSSLLILLSPLLTIIGEEGVGTKWIILKKKTV